jgi:hypothetical protein
MSLFNVDKKYWLLLVIAVFIFFVFGYKVGRLFSWPEQIWLGERYVLMDRYDLQAHYDLDRSLMGLGLYDIENDYIKIGEINFYPSGYIRNLTRRMLDGFIREYYYENGSIKTIYKRNYSLGTSEITTYSEDGNMIEHTEENAAATEELKGRPPASYLDFLNFEHSPWNIRANWATANFKGHLYSYLSSPVPMICLFVMLVTVGFSCKIVLTKKSIFVKCCTIIICSLIDLLMGFAMSWELFLFHRIQARADLLSDSSACGTISLYIGVFFALACLILPLVISTIRSKRYADIH